jgi:protein-disulfide isomerase
MFRPLLSALALVAALAASPAAAFDPAAMTEPERAAFGEAIRAYILANPELLVEAIGVLEARQAAAEAVDDRTLVAVHADAIFSDSHSWVGGNPEGDLVMVEFMDYRCSYCRRAFDEVNQLITTDGNIRFIIKEFPILGPESDLSARFAVAVKQLAGDAVYKEAHDRLMTYRGEINLESLTRLAEELGQQPAPILERMNAPEVTAVLEANHALAQQLNVAGTPTFVLGGQMLRGYLPLDGMRQIVASEREG